MAARHASELELLRFDDEFEGDIRLNEPSDDRRWTQGKGSATHNTSLWLAIPPTVSVALLMPTPK